MPSKYLTTYKDATDHLMNFLGADPGNKRDLQDCRRAAHEALREIVNLHRWSHYNYPGRVATSASYSTGTIDYDHCVTPEHEALTRTGWKRHTELNVGDEILAYDHDSEMCSWQPIQKIHRSNFDGKLLNVYRRGRAVLRCTPNHRIPVFERYGRSRKYRKRFVTATELSQEHFVPLAAPLLQEVGEIGPRLAAILGWTITDGHGLLRPAGSVHVYQSPTVNPQKCREISQLVEHQGYLSKSEKIRTFRVNKQDRAALRQAVSARDEIVPAFCRMVPSEAEAAIRSMVLAEASIGRFGQQSFSQWGRNKPVAEAFQIACLIAGKAANICEREYVHGGTRYQSTVRTSKNIRLSRNSRWEDYKGVVWCPQVATGAWVVRCNGSVMITGNSGGTYERMVTLTTGTWPDWARNGVLLISSIPYEIAERKSDSVITLTSTSNPGADVASGTSYTLYRDSYPLPGNFSQLTSEIIETATQRILAYISPQDWLLQNRFQTAAGTPTFYTITGDPNYQDLQAIRFSPPPATARGYEFIYRRAARRLRTEEYSTGTITVSGTTVTGTSATAFTRDHIGSVLRVSSTSDAPTGLYGNNPFAEERIITGYTDAHTLTIDSAFSGSYSAAKYYVSDPIDVDTQVMLNLFYRTAELHLATIRRPDDRGAVLAARNDELMRAMAADNRVVQDRTALGPGRGIPGIYWSMAHGDISDAGAH